MKHNPCKGCIHYTGCNNHIPCNTFVSKEEMSYQEDEMARQERERAEYADAYYSYISDEQ